MNRPTTAEALAMARQLVRACNEGGSANANPLTLASALLALDEENAGLRADNESQSYKGNSVAHWWAKAHAYGGMVHGCGPILAAAGHPIDASQADGAVGGIGRAVASLVAERDELRRLTALAKSYRDCSRGPEADTTDEEIETMVQTEIDAEEALFRALDEHDAADAARGEK